MNNERNEPRDGVDDRKPEQSKPERVDAVAELMSLAGQRTEIPELAARRVRANVEAEWRRATTPRRILRWSVPVALAASVLLAWTMVVRQPEVVAPMPVGTIAKVMGESSNRAFGDPVYIGDVVATTEAGGLSFALGLSSSIRLDQGSSLRIDDFDEFTLMAGNVYIDTGESVYPAQQVTVNTAFGAVTDIGTQFAVSLGAIDMRVAVREGQVDIATGPSNLVAAMAGDRITVAADESIMREAISPMDSDWDWAEELAPQFAIEGKSVLDFLKWVSRETGMELEFLDLADRQAAMAATLHGSIDNLTPMEALASVMPTTSFDYLIDGDAISVRR